MKFVVLTNRLFSGQKKFTKLTKPPISCFRMEGVIVAIYIDDITVIGKIYEECIIGTIKTIRFFLKLEILTACTKNVGRFDYFLPKLKGYLRNKYKAFNGGCISSKIQKW